MPFPDFHLETLFRIEPPQGRSTTFRVRQKSPETDNKWTALKLSEVDIANKLFLSGTSKEHTHEKLKLLLADLYKHRDRKKTKAPIMSGNLKIVDLMWKEKYNRRRTRNMKSPEDSKYQLTKAAEACGLFPLDTCDLEELADHLDANLGSDQNRLARRTLWINSILQYLGRNKLQSVGRKRTKFSYLNEDEFKSMIAQIVDDDELYNLAHIAFYTGARLGEIFFIQPRHLKTKTLHLELQMTDKFQEDGTYKDDTLKSGYDREIFLYKGVRPELEDWSKVPFKHRYVVRERAYSKLIAKACEKAFGLEDPVKILTFHDLRHCHAIWLLQKGATITEVAQQLGNGLDVCYRYYSGFELKKESVDRLVSLV